MPPSEVLIGPVVGGLGGQNRLRLGVVRGLGGGVGGGRGGSGSQRADQNPAASGSGELFAVLPATDERFGVVAGPVGAAL